MGATADAMPVLSFRPLSSRAWRSRRGRPPFIPAPLIACTGALLSLLIFLLVREAQFDREKDALESRASVTALAMQARMDNYLGVLFAVRGFYAGSQSVERDEFELFSREMLNHNPGLLSVSWMPIVRHADRAAFEADPVNRLPAGGGFTEIGPDGTTRPASERAWYAPLNFVVAGIDPSGYFGFDKAADASLRATLEIARDTGKPTASPNLPLAPLDDLGTGIRIVIAIYKGGVVPGSVAERQEQLLGFASVALRLDGFLNAALGSAIDDETDIYIYDRMASGRLLPIHFRGASGAEEHRGLIDKPTLARPVPASERAVKVADRIWLVTFKQGPDLSNNYLHWLPLLALIGGLAITLLLVGYVALIIGRHRRVREQVKERTAELTAANQLLEFEIAERKFAEERAESARAALNDAIDNMPNGFVLWDSEDRLTTWNEKFEQVMAHALPLVHRGMSFDDFIAAVTPMTEREGDDSSEQWLKRRIASHLKGETALEVHSVSDRWLHIIERRTARGATVSIYTDITSRKQSEAELRTVNQTLRAVIEAGPLPICVADADGIVTLWNPAAEAVFGWRADEVIGRYVPFIPEELRHETGLSRGLVGSGGQRVGQEFRRQRKDGTPIDILVSAAPITDDRGGTTGYIGVLLDVTDRKRTEERLRDANRTLEAIIEACPLPTFLINPDGNVKIWNRAAETVFGWTAEEAIGQPIPFMLLEEQANRGRVRQARHQKKSLVVSENCHTRKDGTPIETKDYVAPIFDDKGNLANYVAISIDITEQKRSEQALRDAKEAAEMANRSKNEFLANMSHELRTPLNAVIGFSDIMEKEMFGPLGADHYRDYVKDIHNSGRHLLGIINDILDLAKIEAGKIELNEEMVDTEEVVESCLRLVKERALGGGIELGLRRHQPVPVLRADKRKLKQILINLLSNALKFTPTGGTVTVSIKTNPVGTVTLAVADTGIGMKPEDIHTAFAVFGQIDSALNRKYEGTGLGLPLTKSLVDLHDAHIAIESEPGVGTTVSVTFPHYRVENAQVTAQAAG